MLKTWITNGSNSPFYVRKIIEIPEKPTTALTQICGLGQFNLYVNGKKVGDHVLDPVWSDYRKAVYYVTFDLASCLQAGKNEILAEIGNGWYITDEEGGYFFRFPVFMPPNPNPYRPFGQELVLAMDSVLRFEDGSSMTVTTGEDWQVADHPVCHSNCYGSEITDGSKKNPEIWHNASISKDGPALTSRLRPQTMPPVKVIRTYEGNYLHTVNGRAIYDFGQNASGMLKFTVRGIAGQAVHAWPAEKLGADGDVDQIAKNWMPIDVCETYLPAESGVFEDFATTFTYVAGRYVAIDASPEDVKDVRLDAITSAWQKAGTFHCDDDRYNRIYNMIERTVEANMLGVHTDCPTIERFAWQEPNHLMAPAIMFMKYGKDLWHKFLTDCRDAQHTGEDRFFDMEGRAFCPGDGLVPSQAPCYIPNVLPVPGMGSFYDIIGWGSTIILGTRWHYLFYGDKGVIEENYDAGMRYFRHLLSRQDAHGFISHGLGDWGNPDGLFARENVETALLYADAVTLAEFAAILGREEDERYLQSEAQRILAHYNAELLVRDSNGRWCYRNYEKRSEGIQVTQACEALPLYWNMVPEDKRADVIACFRETLLDKGAFCAGEVGLPYIIQTARSCGMNDLIAQFITRREHPSYYAFVLAGETTLGEYWEENPRSHCHDMMGHIVEWFYNGIAGIQSLAPGFSKVRINPWMPESMNSLSCSYETPQGTISITGRRVNGIPEYDIKVPENIELIR